MTVIPLFVAVPQRKSSQPVELRFSLSDSITSIKERMYRVTGWSPASISLSLYRGNALLASIGEVNETSNTLGLYLPQPYDTLSVTCNDPSMVNTFDSNAHSMPINSSGSQMLGVKKYEISDEAYSKLPNNAAKWKANLLTQKIFSPDRPIQVESDSRHNYRFNIDDRVMVVSKNDPENSPKATVKYVGPVHFASGEWVGISYDDPLGKHQGTIDQTRYFHTEQNHGSFVKPSNLYLIYSRQNSQDLDLECEDLLEL
jgi:tubulin-folding cofactor B